MTVVDIKIANRALGKAGMRGSMAGADERSSEAEVINRYYDSTLRVLLRSANWNFARFTAYLTQIKAAPGTPGGPAFTGLPWDPATSPPPPWRYSYAVPPDCVFAQFIQGDNAYGTPGMNTPISPVMPFAPLAGARYARFIEASDNDTNGNAIKVFLTDRHNAVLVYTRFIDNSFIWDPDFSKAFEDSLALQIIPAGTGDKQMIQLRNSLNESATGIILANRARDANEGGPHSVNRLPDWLAIRGAGEDWSTAGWDNGFGSIAWENPSFLYF